MFFFIFISYTAVSYLQNLWSPFLISVHFHMQIRNEKKKMIYVFVYFQHIQQVIEVEGKF